MVIIYCPSAIVHSSIMAYICMCDCVKVHQTRPAPMVGAIILEADARHGSFAAIFSWQGGYETCNSELLQDFLMQSLEQVKIMLSFKHF